MTLFISDQSNVSYMQKHVQLSQIKLTQLLFYHRDNPKLFPSSIHSVRHMCIVWRHLHDKSLQNNTRYLRVFVCLAGRNLVTAMLATLSAHEKRCPIG